MNLLRLLRLLRQLRELWLTFVLGHVPLGLPMQCNQPTCGTTVHYLTPAQYNRWKARATVPCRACYDGVLEDAAVWR